MKITRSFHLNRDRYHYDYTECTASKGWMRITTGQDAPYFGLWLQPFTRTVKSYIEGDEETAQAETDEELTRYVLDAVQWNAEHGHGPMQLKPSLAAELGGGTSDRLAALGLAHLIA